MSAALRAGILYFAIIFTLGAGLGSARVLLLEPRIGPVGSVLAELPVILAASWSASRMLMVRLAVPRTAPSALAMGLSALLLLMAAELGLALWTPGRSVAEYVARYGDPATLIGLAGQILFASFPLLHLALDARPSGKSRHEIDPASHL